MLKIKEGFKGERLISLPLFAIEKFKKDELGKELYLTNIGYFPNAEYHYCRREAANSTDYILIYCVKGEGWLEYNGKKLKVAEDQFFIIPQGMSHAYGSSKGKPWSIYWIHFNGKKAGYFSKGFDIPQDMPYNSQSRFKNKIDLFEEIFSTLQSESSTEQMSYATSVFFHFLGIIKCSNSGKKESEAIKESSIIDTSLKFMRENLHKHLSLRNMAEHVNLSVSYFSRIFIAQIGTSPSKYLAQLRMEKACHYLEETEMKVNQISPLVGFDDPLYFSRLFTNYLKLSPTQYRENRNRTLFFRTTTQTAHHTMAI